jgi:hypothetical protein
VLCPSFGPTASGGCCPRHRKGGETTPGAEEKRGRRRRATGDVEGDERRRLRSAESPMSMLPPPHSQAGEREDKGGPVAAALHPSLGREAESIHARCCRGREAEMAVSPTSPVLLCPYLASPRRSRGGHRRGRSSSSRSAPLH